MPRSDLTNFLVHWTKGTNFDEAFDVLRKIVFEKRLLGTGSLIRGEWPCVCFTEAPEKAFHEIFGRYKPFGIKVPKSWLFRLGGRPVIYQSDVEYDQLPKSIQWRHMRYEPDAEPPIDFSWEREWRIQTTELHLGPAHASVLVPEEKWEHALKQAHFEDEEFRREMIAAEYGEEYLMRPLDEFEYHIEIIPT